MLGRSGGQQVVLLDHYLEVLARKPGALPGATALAQARAAGTFTRAHDAFWALARKQAGDGGGTRLLVEALLCTGTWRTSTSSQVWPLQRRPPPPAPTSWQSRPARPRAPEARRPRCPPR